jgi:hypothetical protein
VCNVGPLSDWFRKRQNAIKRDSEVFLSCMVCHGP